MSWTEDRVERLKKLWTDGLSAAQIAAELGGVTRNAVIGKVHRLGMSGRAKPAGSSGGRPARRTRSTGYARISRRSPKNAVPSRADEARARAAQVENLVAPEPKNIALVELTEKTCKWPLGDPQDEDFSFCGNAVKEDTPYCEYHCSMAYQPATERRRDRSAATG